jgi:hypothetical protein
MTRPALALVTIDPADLQALEHCEQCGISPTLITVIRWTKAGLERGERVPQQSHHYCGDHRAAAETMWRLLLDTASPRKQRLG